jgi:GR25 family glycosyltransferase involved in LPS biosynthesis
MIAPGKDRSGRFPLPDIAAFIIHLERAVSRRPQVDWITAALPVPATIVPAVDGRAMNPDETAQVYQRHLFRPHYPFDLKPGEIGCFLSHRRCWQAILDSGKDGGLIIEDDVVFEPERLAKALDLALKHAPKSAYIRLPMKSGRDKGRIIAEADGVVLLECRQPGPGTLGQYVGKDAARALLEKTRRFDRPIDTFLQVPVLHKVPILALLPAMMREMGGDIGQSTIQRDARSLGLKLRRELARARYRAMVRLANR